MSIMEERTKMRNIKILAFIDDDIPDTVFTDGRRVKQILVHLV